MTDFNYIKSERLGHTRLITFDRADCYNAMNMDMKFEIIKAIKAANKAEEEKCIIITGSGKAFTSGQDLNDRNVQSGEKVDLGHTLKTEWNPLIMSIRDSKKLVIAAINGVCAGAGISVALACDIKLAKPGLKFVSGFAGIGLAPDAGTSHTLVRALGYSKALEFALFGTPLMAEDLEKVGLINSLHEDPFEAAKEMAKKIEGFAPLSIEAIKGNFQFALDGNYQECMDREINTQRFLGSSEDYAEGVKAFFEKRTPNFKGK